MNKGVVGGAYCKSESWAFEGLLVILVCRWNVKNHGSEDKIPWRAY